MPRHPRVQVEGVDAPALETAPSRTDVFAPDRTAGSGISQIAEALSTFQPTLRRFADQEFEKQEREAQQAGRAAAFRDNAEEFRKQVRAGEIPEWENPWFRMGFQEVQGKRLADTYAAQLSTRMQEALDDEGSTNPEDFDRIAGEVKSEFMETAFPEDGSSFLGSTFATQAAALEGGLRRQFAQQAGANMVDQTFDELYAHTTTTLQNAPDGQEGMISSIETEMDRLYAVGMDPSKINQTVASAVLQEAVRTNNAGLVSLLSKIRTNKQTGATLAGIRDVGEKISAARRTIRTEKDAIRNEQWDRREDAARVARFDLQDGTIAALQEASEEGVRLDPTDPALTALKTEALTVGVSNADQVVRETVNAWYGTHDNNEDMERVMVSQIWDVDRIEAGNQVTRQDILALLRAREINQGGYNYLANEIAQRDSAFGIGPGETGSRNAVRDPDFTFMLSGFSQTMDSALRMPGMAGKGRIVNEARSRIHRAWTKAYQNGAAQMTPDEKGQLISSIVGTQIEWMAAQGLAAALGTDPDDRPEQYWNHYAPTIEDQTWEDFEAFRQGGEITRDVARMLLLAGVPPQTNPSGWENLPMDSPIEQFYQQAREARGIE